MAKFDVDDAPAKKSRPTGWLAAAVVLIGAGGFAAAYYLPLKGAHALLMSEHEALATKKQELDTALQSSGANLKTTAAEREKLKQALVDASEKEASFTKEAESLRAATQKGLEKLVNAKHVSLEEVPLGADARAKAMLIFRPNTAKVLPFAAKFACGSAAGLSGRSGATITVGVAPDAEDKEGYVKASEQAATLADLLRSSCKLNPAQVRLAVGPEVGAQGDVHLRLEAGRAPTFSPTALLD